MGAHPRAASTIVDLGRTLDACVAHDPVRMLGPDVAARFRGELPFLMKVLAAAEPLSLQAHPSEGQAQAGFAAEDAAGVPRDAPHRNYRDRHHKPELLCALEPFEALCGFRPVAETLAIFDALGTTALDPLRVRLQAKPDARGLRDAFALLMRMADEPRALLVQSVVRAARRSANGPFHDACAWVVRLHDAYADDPGVVASLMLSLVRLAPGEAIFLPAGNLHAYLHGVGVEIMASSDNVLRGGLTPKHVDIDALLDVLDFEPRGCAPLLPDEEGVEAVYRTPAAEFRLSRLTLDAAFEHDAWGPEILLVVAGRCRAEHADGSDGSLVLERGESAFVSPGRHRLVPDGTAVIYRAVVPPP